MLTYHVLSLSYLFASVGYQEIVHTFVKYNEPQVCTKTREIHFGNCERTRTYITFKYIIFG